MEKYHLSDQYGDLISSVINGDIGLFSSAVRRNYAFLVKNGVYIAVEQMRYIAYRNLFKRVWLAEGKNTKLDLSSFIIALNMKGEHDMDILELV